MRSPHKPLECERNALPTLQLANLARSGTRQHKCHSVERVCFWRRQFVLTDTATDVASQLLSMRVREVHVGHTERTLRSMGLFRFVNASSDPPSLLSPTFRRCVPLVWWPVWGYNIGEFFQNSVAPIAEMLSEQVIDRKVCACLCVAWVRV